MTRTRFTIHFVITLAVTLAFGAVLANAQTPWQPLTASPAGEPITGGLSATVEGRIVLLDVAVQHTNATGVYLLGTLEPQYRPRSSKLVTLTLIGPYGPSVVPVLIRTSGQVMLWIPSIPSSHIAVIGSAAYRTD